MAKHEEENLADLLFGLIAVRESFLNRNQLHLVLEAQEEALAEGEYIPLGEVCLRDGHLPPEAVREAVEELTPLIEAAAPGLSNARWVAYRLLEGDHRVRQALLSGELAALASGSSGEANAESSVTAEEAP